MYQCYDTNVNCFRRKIFYLDLNIYEELDVNGYFDKSKIKAIHTFILRKINSSDLLTHIYEPI